MKSVTSRGIICLKDKLNIEYRVCKIEYTLYENEEYEFIFTPYYDVIEYLDSHIFQGIPGLNLDLKKETYIRKNRIPVFISERIPAKNRENYFELLRDVNMEYMDPIEYLIRTKLQYFGDNFYVIPFEERKDVIIDFNNKNYNSFTITKFILDNLAAGNHLTLNKEVKLNEYNCFKMLIYIYEKQLNSFKKNQKRGINKAKKEAKYKGRKPIIVDEISFKDILKKVEKKELTARDGAKELNISIDKYYRLKKTNKKQL